MLCPNEKLGLFVVKIEPIKTCHIKGHQWEKIKTFYPRPERRLKRHVTAGVARFISRQYSLWHQRDGVGECSLVCNIATGPGSFNFRDNAVIMVLWSPIRDFCYSLRVSWICFTNGSLLNVGVMWRGDFGIESLDLNLGGKKNEVDLGLLLL